MARVELQDGDTIEYAREDHGSRLEWTDPDTGARRGWQFAGTLSHLGGAAVREPEHIEAGKHLPVELCRDLVAQKVCRRVKRGQSSAGPAESDAEAAETVEPVSKKGKAAGG